MRFIDRYPIIVTDRMAVCRDFYVRHLGFEARFESSWFTWLASPDQSASIAFMTPDHPSAPPGPEAFGGTGLSLELEVEDAAAAHAASVSSTANSVVQSARDHVIAPRGVPEAEPARASGHTPSDLALKIVGIRVLVELELAADQK